MIDMKASAVTGTETGAIATIAIEIDHHGIIEIMTTAGTDGIDIPVEAAVVTRMISAIDATSTIDTIGRIGIAVAIVRISEITIETVTTEDLRRAIGRESQTMIRSGEDPDRGANLRSRSLCHLLKQHPQSLSQPTSPPDLVPV